MIKVLVVDDDKLVRKGLISAMPWHDFDMQVVGEAGNGEKALEVLESQAIDLLLTDLEMPVMSGIELMRIARQRLPHLHIVVLTLHQDFEYIQEALRLGAIDYIAKVQLEKEQFEEVLRRIAARIQKQPNLAAAALHQDESVKSDQDQGYVLMSLHGVSNSSWVKELNLPREMSMIEADRNVFFCFSDDGHESTLFGQLSAASAAKPEWTLLLLTGLKGFTHAEIQIWLRKYRDNELFYAYDPDNKTVTVSIRQEEDVRRHYSDEEKLERLKETWLTLEWVHSDILFQSLLREFKDLKLPQVKLIGVLYYFVNEWNRLFAQTNMGKIHFPESPHSWFQVEQWIGEIRGIIKHFSEKSHYSQEITDCMMRAVQIMEAEMDSPLTAAEVAKRLNLSRSYFSQCFKDIIGRTFNDHMRHIRMEKAKEYLRSSNKTICWVAENTGYTDEKYFSRVFREYNGMLPSEFRLSTRMGG
ncbi:response regulator transcription factor [Paenibacillus beijingensis]|uniref:Chemotaxis protein CheY n=1 Tax=Paenibacillus beijingensis TaxID=1126833 RepID=A0A0D5NDS1_9BACL|nr:response regulator [Paenibacillus beijingensis]AJY73544.1 hypothetical protein VN24_01515 [Paenibacillus beijingensis]